MAALTPRSGYAPETRWVSLAKDQTRILNIGGARGGSHGNVRWTTCSGTAANVEETPQSFYAFGGWGAGDLVDVVVLSGGDAIIGTWQGAQAGLDAAVWLRSSQLLPDAGQADHDWRDVFEISIIEARSEAVGRAADAGAHAGAAMTPKSWILR